MIIKFTAEWCGKCRMFKDAPVDKVVDNFYDGDFVVDKVGVLWIKQITRYTLYPVKHIAIKQHFIMRKCVFYAFFSVF